MTFDNVFWKTFNESGSSIKESKSHLVEDLSSNKALCGTDIPNKKEGVEVEGGYGGNGACKRCEKAAK